MCVFCGVLFFFEEDLGFSVCFSVFCVCFVVFLWFFLGGFLSFSIAFWVLVCFVVFLKKTLEISVCFSVFCGVVVVVVAFSRRFSKLFYMGFCVLFDVSSTRPKNFCMFAVFCCVLLCLHLDP